MFETQIGTGALKRRFPAKPTGAGHVPVPNEEKAPRRHALSSPGTHAKLALRAPAGHSPQDVPISRLHAFGDRRRTFEVNVTIYINRARPERAR